MWRNLIYSARDLSNGDTGPGKVAQIVRATGTLTLYASLTHYFYRTANAWWNWGAVLLFALGTIITALYVADAGLNLAAPEQAGERGYWSRGGAFVVLLALGGLVSFLVIARVEKGG